MPDGWDDGTQTYYLDNQATTLDSGGNGTWNGNTYGWDAGNQRFSINGRTFSDNLNQFGNGFDPSPDNQDNYVWYRYGFQTTLNYPGNVGGSLSSWGIWNGQAYIANELTGDGYIGDPINAYCLNGSYVTTLDSSGNGTWNGPTYFSGVIASDGWNAGTSTYYTNGGYATTLDSSGDGLWNGQGYVGGSLVGSGWYEYNLNAYFLNSYPTTLDTSGDGWWNGDFYAAGVITTKQGWDGTHYWLDGASTPLDSSGLGIYNDQVYVGGTISGLLNGTVASTSQTFNKTTVSLTKYGVTITAVLPQLDILGTGML